MDDNILDMLAEEIKTFKKNLPQTVHELYFKNKKPFRAVKQTPTQMIYEYMNINPMIIPDLRQNPSWAKWEQDVLREMEKINGF